jgi:hypothetical protein
MLNPIAVLDQTNPMSFTVENGTAYLKMDWNMPYALILRK